MDVAEEDADAGAGSSSSEDESMVIGCVEDMKKDLFTRGMSSVFHNKKGTVYKQCDYKVNFS
mgnify:CR=1 FL=1